MNIEAYGTYLLRERGVSDDSAKMYCWFVALVDKWLRDNGKSWGVPHCSDYIRELSREGLASKTVFLRAAIMRSYLAFIGDPAAKDLQGPKCPREIPFCPNVSEMAAILEAAGAPRSKRDNRSAPNVEKRNAALLELAYATGVRVRELCGMRIGDVLRPDCTVFVVRAKRGKQYVVNSNEAAINKVIEYLDTFPKPLDRSAWLFPRPTNNARPLDAKVVRRLIERCERAVKLRDHVTSHGGRPARLTPHTFRRACASHLLNRLAKADDGARLEIVRKQLGHTNSRTTALYCVYDGEHLAEWHKRFPLERIARGEPADYFPPAPHKPAIDFTRLGPLVN